MAFPSPSLTPPTLSAWQFSYNGLTFGQLTPHGVDSVEGLDLPAIRTADVARPRDHGEFGGLDLYGGRDITFDLNTMTDGVSLQSALLSLAAATDVAMTNEQPLWFQLPNLPLMAIMCRPRKRTIPFDIAYSSGQALPVVQFHATDPRIYAAPSTSVQVSLPAATGGIGFPVTFPAAFGGGGGGGGVTIDNTGNMEMRPVLVITGPCTNPSVENGSLTGAPAITLANPFQTGYTVLSGDQLVIDMDLRSVLYYVGGVGSGTVGGSRRSWIVLGSQWWTLQPGNNLIHFLSQDSGSVSATLAVQYASAYQL